MSFVAVLLNESPSIEMGAPRAVIVNHTVISELRPVLIVQFGQRSLAGKLKDNPE